MADVMFTSARKGSLMLNDGTNTYFIKCLAGTVYSMGDNDVIIDGAQGSSVAAPSSALTGMYTPRLDVVCHLYPWETTAGWFNAAFLKYALGADSADLTNRVTYPNLRTFQMKYVQLDNAQWSTSHADSATFLDTLKLAAISFEAAPGTAILCRMTFLGIGAGTGVTATYADSPGAPLYWKNLTAMSITQGPPIALVSRLTADIAGTTQGLSWGYSTGAGYGKIADASDYPSLVDVLTVLGASMSIDQRAGGTVGGAGSRAWDSRNATFGWTLGGIAFTMQVNRQGRSVPMNPSGMLVDRTNWQMYWHTVAAAAAGCA